MNMFGTVTNKEIVDVQRAFNTRCYSFNYGIDFQAEQGDRCEKLAQGFYTAATWPGIEPRICDTLVRRSTSKPPSHHMNMMLPNSPDPMAVNSMPSNSMNLMPANLMEPLGQLAEKVSTSTLMSLQLVSTVSE